MHLDRLMQVLEVVAVAGRSVNASEVQKLTGLPRPTCYRLLQTMEDQGLLEEAEPGRYLLGTRLVRLALLGQTDVDVCQTTAPTLQKAADYFGETVFLSRFRNEGVEIIHVEVPTDAKRSFVHPGLGFRPMHACSCSKVIAAFAEEAFQKSILDGPMRSYTEHTLNTRDALLAEFKDIQLQGYATCNEEIETGVSSVAAPIRIREIGATFSIGATGPVRRFTESRRLQIGETLCEYAKKIATALQVTGGVDSGRNA